MAVVALPVVVAIVAVVAEAALVAVFALPVTLPVRLPVNAPARRLLALVATTTPTKLFVPAKALVPLSSMERIGGKAARRRLLPLKLAAEMVAVAALPVRFAVMVPAEKLPLASRATMVLAVFALVAALALVAPWATFAALTPPTWETTVAVWLPVTSPASAPVKLLAVVAVAAVVAEAALVAVFALPVKLPENTPARKLLALVATTTPAKLFVPAKALVPLSSGMLAESCASETLPLRFAAVVAVAALPARFAVMVPAEKLPLASPATRALGVFALVAALAALAALAMLAALTPPTWATTVAVWLPVTSPASGPEKLLAVAAARGAARSRGRIRAAWPWPR